MRALLPAFNGFSHGATPDDLLKMAAESLLIHILAHKHWMEHYIEAFHQEPVHRCSLGCTPHGV